MAALAELLHARGFAVTGTDVVAGANVERLRRLGIRVDVGHDAARVGVGRGRRSLVGDRATTIPSSWRRASRGLPIVGRGALLAECLRKLDVVAIAGSHGKTTTTAMTAHLLRAAGLDPTSVVGGRVPLPDGDAGPLQLGRSEWAVAEVDESDGSFLAMRPVVAVVTNADPEHLDYYGTRERMLDAFVRLRERRALLGRCDPRHRPPGRGGDRAADRACARSISDCTRTPTSAPKRSRPGSGASAAGSDSRAATASPSSSPCPVATTC